MIIDFVQLSQQCAPNVDVPVASAIVKSESSFNPFAIGVNKGGRLDKQPKTYNEAVSIAKKLIAQGKNIDMGLGQINSANLRRLNLSVEQVLDPCINLGAMQKILNECRSRASGNDLYQAFSCYNTGNHSSGFRNGYVAKVSNNLNYFANSNNRPMSINFAPEFNTRSLDSEGLAAFANSADMPTNLPVSYQQQTQTSVQPQTTQYVQQRQSEIFFISEHASTASGGGKYRSSMIF
ncbi:lytic transglycosylase domain-containing protein [Acinetobacter baumannii]|nr:lytic transglycosylase domain-containing protein [Acinetobacter baumannii]